MINPDTNYISKWYGKILHIYNPVYRINYYFVNAKTFDDYIKVMKDKFNLIFEKSEKNGFFTIIVKPKYKCDIGVIWVKKPIDQGVLAHECFHATCWTARKRGFKLTDSNSEESYAYLISYLMDRINEAL